MRAKGIVPDIAPVAEELIGKAQARLDDLTKPVGSLGRLEEFARRVVAITGETMPILDKKVIFTFAGDHGVVAEGVSAYPSEVTPQMVFTFLNGGAGINVLARHAGADVVVVDIGVDYAFEETPGLVMRKVMRGTRNMLAEPAMTREEAEACLKVGIDLAYEYAGKGYKFFGTGDMGIGNTTPSSAIAAVLTGKGAAEVTGRGTGISDGVLARKVEVINESIRHTQARPGRRDRRARKGGRHGDRRHRRPDPRRSGEAGAGRHRRPHIDRRSGYRVRPRAGDCGLYVRGACLRRDRPEGDARQDGTRAHTRPPDEARRRHGSGPRDAAGRGRH